MARKEYNNNGNELINQFLEEKDFFKENNNEDIQKIKQNISIIFYKQNFITFEELGIENCDNFVDFFYIKNEDELEMIKKIIESQNNIEDKEKYGFYYIIMIVENYKMKLIAEKWKQEIRNLVKKTFNCKSIARVIYQIIQDVQNDSKEFDIQIDSRLSSISMPLEDDKNKFYNSESISSKVSSYVFTANLYDIANMYNYIGDALFDKNVRYKLKDVFDVEKSILDTLDSNPEDFWYLNNGITMMVSSRDKINLFNPNKLILLFEEFGDISVVNGAQTISTAANYFFNNSISKEKLTNAKEHAKVILRVMYVNDISIDCKNDLNKISVSLNRQKPISVEDIAYTSERIFEINQLYNEYKDEFHFYISKRGEETIKKYVYNIPTFMRAYVAYYCQKPGDARSKSSKNIIDNVLNNILINEIDDKEFKKLFKPLNFVITLGNLYDKYSNKYKSKIEYKNIIVKNGKYYFISLVMISLAKKDNLLKENGHYNYSEFIYSPDYCNNNKKLE